uniref:Uncharacterized protein n=1 Tax=Globodera pallida TaxID=36090 RepID=A0A183CBR1_GLOPA
MFIPFKNHFLPQQQHNAKVVCQIQQQQQQFKKFSSKNNCVPTMLLLFTAVLFACSALQVAHAMPLQMLLMYTPDSSGEGPDDILLFPMQRPHLALIRKAASSQKLLANALLSPPNDDAAQTRHMEELMPSSNSNTYKLLMKRMPYGSEAIDELKNDERPSAEQKQNLLRAGRNIEENTAPKMYARHIGDLGGTMFRFG